MPSLNYKRIASQLLHQLRGSKSQAYLNQKLGFSGNQVYRWEKGLRQASWQDFVTVCKILKVDLLQIFRVQFGYQEKNLDSHLVVKHLIGNSKINEVSDTTGFTRSVLTKWLGKKTIPQLHQILQLLENPNRLLIVFVNELIGSGKIKELLEYETMVQTLKNLYYREPVLGAIMAFLETMRFQEKDQFIGELARLFEADESKLKSFLKELVDIGFLEENKSGLWEMKIKNFDTRGGSFRQGLDIRLFWFGQIMTALKNVTSGNTSHLFPFFVFSISEQGEKKLREAHYQYVSHLKAIIENDTDEKRHVRVIAIGDVQY